MLNLEGTVHIPCTLEHCSLAFLLLRANGDLFSHKGQTNCQSDCDQKPGAHMAVHWCLLRPLERSPATMLLPWAYWEVYCTMQGLHSLPVLLVCDIHHCSYTHTHMCKVTTSHGMPDELICVLAHMHDTRRHARLQAAAAEWLLATGIQYQHHCCAFKGL